MADKVCANCGSEVPAAAVFCTQCGSRDLTEAAVPPPPEQPPAQVITPDGPTIAVDDPYEPPSYAAQLGSSASTATPQADPPTIPDQTVIDEPTAMWSSPPPAPATAPSMAPPPAPAAPQYQYQAPGPAPTPANVAPDAPAKLAGGGKVGAALVFLGGAAAILGAFLEWMKITPEWADAITFSGWTLSDDAKIAAGVGAVAVVAAIAVLGSNLRAPMRILAALAGIVLVALGAYDTYDILQELPDALEAANVSGIEIAAPGIGLILVMAGGAVVLLGALAMRGGKKETPTVPQAGSRAPGTPPGSFATSAPPVGGYAPPPGASPASFPTSGPATGGYGQPPGGYAPPQSGGFPPPQSEGYPPPSAPFR
ncbi:MAG TPA: zinc ribbon domain-containing protein [Acidimicrobiales bacterium]|nr:zinc ribbon domain-containing protein [Acidimicrobiales bacterium]